MTSNRIGNVIYHNNIKTTNNSAVYKPSSSIKTEPLSEQYSIGDNIGRGKFAVVKKCTNKTTEETLAAKFIKKRRRGKSCREEILREVVMLEMALDHPRLVNLKEVYETPQELILITEYCSGGELFTECILEEKFNEADVRLLLAQILEGLVYLHDKNIVHLDLKPQNILLTDEFPNGSVKICDLGFACLVNTGEDIRDIIGTPDYVAPEVLNYDPLGLYTDMWSLGVLTYVMLTTCSPFAAEDKQMTFCNITTVNLEFPDDLWHEISTDAQDFIKQLLIAEPSERMTAQDCLQHPWLYDIFHTDAPSPQPDIKPKLTPSELLALKQSCANKYDDVQFDCKNFEGKCDDIYRNVNNVSNNNQDNGLLADFPASMAQVSQNSLPQQSSHTCLGENVHEEGVHNFPGSHDFSNNATGSSDCTGEGDTELHDLHLHKHLSEEVPTTPATDYTIDHSENTGTPDTIGGPVTIDQEFNTNTSKPEYHNLDSEINETDTIQTVENSSQSKDHQRLSNFVNTNFYSEAVSPDTDSSMCVSDSRVVDTDSGMVTGSDTKSVESISANLCSSGRASVELDLIGENESSVFDDATSSDMEMLNKSAVDFNQGGGKGIQEEADRAISEMGESCESGLGQSDGEFESRMGLVDQNVIVIGDNNAQAGKSNPNIQDGSAGNDVIATDAVLADTGLSTGLVTGDVEMEVSDTVFESSTDQAGGAVTSTANTSQSTNTMLNTATNLVNTAGTTSVSEHSTPSGVILHSNTADNTSVGSNMLQLPVTADNQALDQSNSADVSSVSLSSFGGETPTKFMTSTPSKMSTPLQSQSLPQSPLANQVGSTTGGRSSISTIDDSINSMQLGEQLAEQLGEKLGGERLKRGMCNESATSGSGLENEEEIDYEFISVSKRVRSIEDSMTTTRSPPFSPKIARSPRIGRHSRNHHHQHH